MADVSRPGEAGPHAEYRPQGHEPSTAEVRAWARRNGLPVPEKGRLRPEVWDAYRAADAG